jgi:hypothetical protein
MLDKILKGLAYFILAIFSVVPAGGCVASIVKTLTADTFFWGFMAVIFAMFTTVAIWFSASIAAQLK